MKHKVFKKIESLRDVDDFLKSSGKFSKKFYSVDLKGGENVRYELVVNAVAISRDLVYKIGWNMKAESLKDHIGGAETVRDCDAPIYGWIPAEEKELKKFYPNVAHVPDEPGESHWITLFQCYDFVRVDSIEMID